jgi:hypothetical protein
LTTGHVCHCCNTGWMCDLEGAAAPILKPMITGNPSTLSQAEQLTVATWATKTAMVIETATPTAQNDRFLRTQCEIVKQRGHPPGLLRIFAGGIEGVMPPMGSWTSRSHVDVNGAPLCDLHIYTILVGTLILQILRPDPPPPNYGALKTLAEPNYGEIPIFPPVERFAWPPKSIFNIDGLISYTTRGTAIPKEWTVPVPGQTEPATP